MSFCPPKSILPKGTIAPNAGNVSSTMSRAQILQNQAKYCGQSGVVYVTNPTNEQMLQELNALKLTVAQLMQTVTELKAMLA